MSRPKVLVVRGGWDGHDPVGCTDLVLEPLADQYQISYASSFEAYSSVDELLTYDLIIQCWSMGSLTDEQEAALVGAVTKGVGFAGWHGGIIGTCVSNAQYLQMVGGRFVWHPEGFVTYPVHISEPDNPIVAGLRDFEVTTEQYWLLSDDGNRVLATCSFATDETTPWPQQVTMPVTWQRQWGHGKVFVCTLGHNTSDLQVPETAAMISRGLRWACR